MIWLNVLLTTSWFPNAISLSKVCSAFFFFFFFKDWTFASVPLNNRFVFSRNVHVIWKVCFSRECSVVDVWCYQWRKTESFFLYFQLRSDSNQCHAVRTRWRIWISFKLSRVFKPATVKMKISHTLILLERSLACKLMHWLRWKKGKLEWWQERKKHESSQARGKLSTAAKDG